MMRVSIVSMRCLVGLFAVYLLLTVVYYFCFLGLTEPPSSVRHFDVHGSTEFHNLLLDTSEADCSNGEPLKMELPASDFETLLDVRDFKFRINQPACRGEQQLLTIVHSAPRNWEKRMQIRKTWGSDLQGHLLFLLGDVDSPLLQLSLESENNQYHDIVQGTFRDAYRNMTYKHVMSLKWTLYFCPGVRYLLKTDDDTFINTPVLIQALTQGRLRCGMKNLLLCRLWSGVAVNRTGDKWMVTQEEFSHNIYPDYCSGTAILYSQDVVYALYRKAQETPYFWVDDVHLTGTVAEELNLRHDTMGIGTLSIRFTHNTVKCDHSLEKDAPSWIRSFLFSRHDMSTSDMAALWWYVKNCTMTPQP